MVSTLAADPLLHLVLRGALAALFATAALHKLRDGPAFVATLRNYRVLPDLLVPLVAALLIGIELAVAAALLALGEHAAALAAITLLALYSGAIAVNLARGRRDIDCGCLGPRQRQALSEWLLLRNALLLAAAALLLVPPGSRSLAWLDAFSLVATWSCFALIWASANRLMQTWPRMRPLRWRE